MWLPWEGLIQAVRRYTSIVPLQVHCYSEALPTTALILCRSQHAEVLPATMSEGLAQDPYVAARVGFEPATTGHKAPTDTITEPPCPSRIKLKCSWRTRASDSLVSLAVEVQQLLDT